MKQGRLSFGSKRKDSDTFEGNESTKNVIEIGDSPEKQQPPPKKICLENNNNDQPGSDEHNAINCDSENSCEQTQLANNENETPNHAEKSAENDSQHSDASSEGETPMDESMVSTADSSLLDSTIGSTADEDDTARISDTTSSPKVPGAKRKLSRTEASFQRLAKRKNKELKEKEKEAKMKLREEEKRKRAEEKERREQEKKEAKERKEKERLDREKKKEDERLQKEKEKQEKEKKKEEERILKEKERIEKEKDREEKEKEKRKREEEKKREQEEESAKKEKAKQAFMSFFVKKSKEQGTEDENEKQTNDEGQQAASVAVKFKPFQLKKDMKLAQLVSENAKSRFDRLALDACVGGLMNANKIELYLAQLKSSDYKPHKYRRLSEPVEDDDVIVLPRGPEEQVTLGGKIRAKLIQFVENYRPAYYGTWRKSCSNVNGRRPFGKYSEFDYTVDSDDEWEEEEGESILGTDDEKEKEDNENEEDYEEDDFLVPHGYLSESEEDENDDQPLDPEALKARIAARQEEFKADRKAGLQKKKIVAVCAVGSDGRNLEAEYNILKQFQAVLLVAAQQRPLKPSWEREPDFVINTKDSEPKVLTDEALKLFCETAHGFQGGVRHLYEQFCQKWKAVSDLKIPPKSLKMTLTATCKKSKARNMLVVNNDLVEKFSLTQLENENPDENSPAFTKFLPDEVIPDLIRVAHGSSKTTQVLDDFVVDGKRFGKAQVKRTLRNIATFEHALSCWVVRDDVLKQHKLENLNSKLKTIEDKNKEKKERKKDDQKKTPEDQKSPAEEPVKKSDESRVESQSVQASPKTDREEKGKENKESTPKSMSIKKFFSPKPRAPTSLPSTSTAQITTPKVKKRIQLTTLSRTPTLKTDSNKTQSVLHDKEEILIIEDGSN